MATKYIGDGAIAGIITGVIMGILTVLLALAGLASAATFIDLRTVLRGMIPVASIAMVSLTAMITLLLFMAIIGLIIGAVYGAVYESIPTTHAITRGVIFLLAIWVVFGLLIPVVLSTSNALPAALTAAGILSALVAAIMWGGMLGLIFYWIVERTGVPARHVSKMP